MANRRSVTIETIDRSGRQIERQPERLSGETGYCRVTPTADRGRSGAGRPLATEPAFGPAETRAVRGCRPTSFRRSLLTTRGRVVVGAMVAGLLLVLALPLSAVGGKTIDGARAVAVESGQPVAYVVQPGDTLATVARRLSPGPVAATERRLVAELDSHTVVPGERVALRRGGAE